ncbi:MAG TPA: WD40 repeat domain-containing protein [Bacteroidota bacterium]|nr:WD40 repeat domain-containing protein [Bacteroidota bacterium]
MIHFERSGWDIFRLLYSPPFCSSLTLLILFFGGTACNVAEPEPEPVRFHTVTIIDSTLTSAARFTANSGHPELRLQVSLTLRIDADSGRIIQYSVRAGEAERQYLPPPNTIPNGSQYVLTVNETFQNLSPWTSRPSIRVIVQLKTWVGARDSTRTIEIVSQRPVVWENTAEPGLRSIGMKSGYDLIGGIVWTGDNHGFYFHSRWTQNQNEVIQYFKLADSSITDFSPTSASFRMLDISHDQQSLLLADGGVRASNLYLYNRAGNLQRLLVEARDSLIVTSGRFSFSDYRVAFSTVRGANRTEPSVRLFDARDSTLVRFDALSTFPAHTLLCWLPFSNDRFVFHSGGSDFRVFSVSSGTVTRFSFTTPFVPRVLLADGFTVLGWRVETADEHHVWIYTINSEPVRQLTFLPQTVTEASISPNGRTLAFVAKRGSTTRLFILPLNSILDKR